jgi:ribosome-binding protein aMBF1 (putative translation factor)
LIYIPGKPVIKKSRKKSSEKVPGQHAPVPIISHQAASTQQIESKDRTYIRIPGDVESDVRMRISDAKNRKIISKEVFAEFIKLRANSTEEISFVDTITVVPEKTYNIISGIPQKPEEKKLSRIKQKLNFDKTQ